MDLDIIRERLHEIEQVFCDIRDDPRTPPEIQRKADFGQGRVANLKSIIYLEENATWPRS